MDTLTAIATRRSVREFLPQPIERAVIEKILQAAMSAPSANKQQPWDFVVITAEEIKAQLPNIHPYAKMCLSAPIVIMVCIATARRNYKPYWVQDLAAASQNILLAARDLGLGAVWVGVYPRRERIEGLQKLLHLDPAIIPFNLIPIGYTTVSQEPQDSFILERVHYNKW